MIPNDFRRFFRGLKQAASWEWSGESVDFDHDSGAAQLFKKKAIEYAKHMHEQAKHEWVQVLGYIHIAHLPSFDGGCSEHLILQVWTRWKPVGTGYGPMGFLIPKHSYSYEVLYKFI